MIWVLGIALSLVVGLYLGAPFLAAEPEEAAPLPKAEVEAYRNELRAMEAADDPGAQNAAKLKSMLLKAAKAPAPNSGKRSLGVAGGICLSLVGASLVLYSVLGSPNFTPEVRQAPPALAATATNEYAALLPRFEARLAENPEDAVGWTLYGRTLMLSGDTEAGLRAYERALELTDTPEIRKEYEAAQRFSEQVKSSPDADTIKAMQNLSEADRTAAIEGMVESLRTRLETDPSDADGWARLLRSRKVLGQEAAAQADMETLRQALPEQADAIITGSGWTN